MTNTNLYNLNDMERALDDVLAEGFHEIYPEENSE